MQNSCPVCSAISPESRFRVEDHFLSGEEFEILKCPDCEFSFTLNPPPETDIKGYYKSTDYISHSDTKSGLTNRLYHLARNWMLGRKYKLIRRTSQKTGGKLLDIGCGTGYFAGYMSMKGWKCTGIEADENAKKYAREKFELEVHGLNKLAEIDNSEFDVVTLWHVLEHLYDPSDVLKNIDRILRKGGVCVIALPNTDSYDAKFYKEYWAAWDVPRHLWHFNISSFTRILNNSGLRLEAIRKLPLDALYISILSERYLGSRLSFIKGILIGKIGWFSSFFRKSRSSSLVYILRK